MRASIINIQSYIFYLIPISLLTGPFLPDLFLSIVSIIFVIISIKERTWKYYKNNFFLIFVIFYLILIIVSLKAEFKINSIENSFFYFRFGIFSLTTWFLINEKVNFIRNFTIIFLITFLLALFDGYFQYFYNSNLFGYTGVGTRLTILFNDKLILGGYLVRLFPLLIALILLLNIKNYTKIFISICLFLLVDILVYLTGERTAFSLALVFSIFIIFFTSNYKLLRLLTLIISLTIIYAITLSDNRVMQRNVEHTLQQTNIKGLLSSGNFEDLVFFSPQHHSHIVTAYKMFLDKPLFGHGVNSFRIKCKNKKYELNELSCSTHPHHTYSQLLSETGIIGTIPIFLVILFLFIRIIKHTFISKNNQQFRMKDYQIFLISAFVITLWPLAPSQNFFNNWINIIYYLPLGFYLNSIYSNEVELINSKILIDNKK